MLRDEFERRIQDINRRAEEKARPTARIDAARFTARLEGESLVGTAELDVKLAGSSSGLVDLHPCGAHLMRPRWKEGAGELPRIGLDGRGRWCAWVQREGTLEFEWTLPSRGELPSLEYALALPVAPTRQLTLELPDRYMPLVAGSVVRELNPGVTGEPTHSRRYQIELGGLESPTLTLRPVGTAQPTAPVTARQSQRYDINPSGTVLAARFVLEARDHAVGQFRVRLEPGLRLMSVRMGNRRLAWSSRAQLDHGGDIVTIEVAAGPGQVDDVLTLDAIARTVIGKPWRLPAMRPQDVLWQDGSTEIAVGSGLKFVRVNPVKGQISSPLTAGELRIQHFEPDASIHVHVQWQTAPVSLHTGTVVVVEPGRATATCRCEGRGKFRTRGLLRGELTAGWIVDSVQTEPDGVLDDWNIERDKDGRTWLNVRLKPSTDGDRARVSIAARSEAPRENTPWTFDKLRPIRWEGETAVDSRNVMAIRARSPWSLSLTGDEELSPIDSATGSPDRELLGDSSGGVAFVVDASARRLRVGLRPALPRFSAEIQVEAEIGRTSLIETATLRCKPDGEALDHLLVHWSGRRAMTPLTWRLNGQPVEARYVRQLTDAQKRQAGLELAGETWQVMLDPARTEQFELSATRTAPYSATDSGGRMPRGSPDEVAVGLAALPEAAAQEGRVMVWGRDGLLPHIRTERVVPIAPPHSPLHLSRNLRGAYRYEPLRDALSALPAALRIAVPPTSESSSALVVRADLESRVAADGTAQHCAAFEIESAGQSEVAVTLPAGAVDSVVTVQGSSIARPTRSEDSGTSGAPIVVDLPPEQRYCTVVVTFATYGSPLGWFNSIAAPWPEIDLPVAARTRRVWLPENYRTWGGGATSVTRGEAGQSWAERLFGPFARDAATLPAGASWMSAQANAAGAFDPLEARRAAQTWLAKLGAEVRLLRQADSQTAASWGQVLSRVEEGVYIDEAAFVRRGLTPLAQLPPTSGIEDRDLGIDLLSRFGLCLCVHRDALLLTTTEAAAEYGDELTAVSLADISGSPNNWCVARSLPGELTRRLTRAADGEAAGPFRKASAWIRGPVTPAMWRHEGERSRWGLELRGWTLHVVGGADPAGDHTVSFVSGSAIEACGWAVLLASIAAGYELARRRPFVWLAVVTALALAALAIGPDYSPLAQIFTGALVGCAIGGGIQLIRRPRAAGKQVVATAAILLAMLPGRVISPKQVLAQEDPATGAAAGARKRDAGEARLYRVFDPVNAELLPEGKYVYLSEAFFDELHRREKDEPSDGRSWLITGAEYRAVFHATASEGLSIDGVSARFQIVTNVPSRSVHLPLAPPEPLDLASIRLNGATVASQDASWDQGGLNVHIRGPGSHVLEVPLAAASTRIADGHRRIDVAIPRVPQARVELSVPPGAGPVAVLGAANETQSNATGKVSALVSGLDRLRVQWPSAVAPDSARPRVQVDPLFWLQVQPGNVTLRARFYARVSGPPLTRVDFEADSRLVLLSPTQGARWEPTGASGDKHARLSLELKQPIIESGMVDLEFLLQGVSGIGNLRLPKLEWSGGVTSPAVLAVSLDPSLEITAQPGESRTVTSAEFVRKWAAQTASSASPTLAYDLGREAASWNLSTRRIPSITEVDQTTTLRFQRGRVEIVYDALLTAKAGGSFAHVVHLGDELKDIRITRVAALPVAPGLKGEIGIDQVASWSDDGQGHVTAFLTRRSTGQLRLVVEGVLEIAPAGSMALPELALVGGDLARRKYIVERHSGVDLRVQGTGGLTPISVEPLSSGVTSPESSQSRRSSSGRPPEPPATGKSDRPSAEERPHVMVRRFGAWLAGDSASGVVSWQVNEPIVTATLATTILPKLASRWNVQVAARLHVEQGVLDGVRIAVPPGWSEQVSISPAAPSHWESRSTGERVLVIRPASPIAGEYSLEMSGEFSLGTDKRAPIVELVGAAKQERWLILPTVWKGQRVLWKRRGLRESNLPTTFAAPAEPDARFAAYEILGVGSELFWESFTPAQSEPSVALADVWIGRQDTGQRIGAATFEVLPAGRSACVLQCPEGVRILQARIGDIPIRPVALDERNQRIDFGATFMPQTINIVFAVESAVGAESGRASAPRIRDWPVARTLWTTHDAQGPPASGQTRHDVDAKARKSSGLCTALDQWRARREVLSQLWDVATQQSPTDASSWAPSWRRRLAIAKAHENGLVRSVEAAPARPDEYAYVVVDPRTDSQRDFADQLAALAHEHQGIVLGQFDDATYCEVPRARQNGFREAVRSAIPSAAVRTMAAPPTSLGTTDFLARAGLGGGQVQHWHWDGSAFEMEFRPIEAAGSRGKGRWTAFFILSAAVGVVIFARRQRRTVLALGLPLSFPLAVGGVFWWLFLWPSWIGLVIIAAAVGSGLRFPFLARP